MKHTLQVVFGQEQVLKIYNNTPLTEEEIHGHVKEYQFDSEKEKQAFITGLQEALGWIDLYISDAEVA